MADRVSPSWTRYSTFTRLELIESCAINGAGVLRGRDSATGTDRSVRAAIKNNNTGEIYQMMAESGDLGMLTLEQDLKRLYLQKRISLDTAIANANNKRRLQQLLNLTTMAD